MYFFIEYIRRQRSHHQLSRKRTVRYTLRNEGDGEMLKEPQVESSKVEFQRGQLQDQIDWVNKRRNRLETAYFSCLTGGVFVLVAGLGLLIAGADVHSVEFILAIMSLMLSAAGLVTVPSLKARIRSYEARHLDLTFE